MTSYFRTLTMTVTKLIVLQVYMQELGFDNNLVSRKAELTYIAWQAKYQFIKHST